MTAHEELDHGHTNPNDEDAPPHAPLLSPSDDVEKQLQTNEGSDAQQSSLQNEAIGSSTKRFLHLGLYFLMNLSLTFYNKAILGHFSFPWILTAIHTGTSSLGCLVLLRIGYFQLTKLNWRDNFTLFLFSLLFTVNIAMSNVSLAMVSVPFHQIMRATCPIFTILIYRMFFSRTYSTSVYLSIIPIVGGVGLATFGDYQFSALGFVLTLQGVILASVKTVVSNRMMTGKLKLPPLEIILRMGPLAASQSLLYSLLVGEFSDFFVFVNTGEFTPSRAIAVAGNGLLAFGLNVASFQTNKLAGALTLTICANLKQCLTVILGGIMWNVPMTAVSAAGVIVALTGAAWYSSIELMNKRQNK